MRLLAQWLSTHSSRSIMHARAVRSVVVRAASTFPRYNGIAALSPEPLQGDEVSLVPASAFEQEVAKIARSDSEVADAVTAKHFSFYGADTASRGLLLSVGPKDKEASVHDYRKATSSAIASLQKLKAASATINVSCPDTIESAVGDAVLQAALLSGYKFDKYITKEDAKPSFIKEVAVKVNGSIHTNPALEAACKGTILARDLTNERADVANPEGVHNVAQAVADSSNAAIKVHAIVGLDALRGEGMNLMAAVAQASVYEPRLVCLEHIVDDSPEAETIVLVGKGVTFDTGGLNLKPTNFIETMHCDMGGSAAVIGCMHAIAQTKPHVNVVGIVGLVENAIGSNAYKPNAVIKSKNGQTVEVGNTDAEGRLVLADAMTYAQEKYSPSTMIELSTLTGACVVALGHCAAGLFSTSSTLSAALAKSGDDIYERAWPMPLYPEYDAELKGSVGDINSTGPSRYGGACTAAAFLKSFVDEGVHWAHVDIAGPADYPKDDTLFPKGATGFGVQLLSHYIHNVANAKSSSE